MTDKKDKSIGIIGTLIFHIIIMLTLIFAGLPFVDKQDEEGVLVMVGVEDVGANNPSKNFSSSAVESVPKQITSNVKTESVKEVKEELVSQNIEESVQLEEQLKKKKEQEQIQKNLELERIKAEEARLKKDAEEKRLKEEAIKNRVSNVFQNSNNNDAGSTGTTEAGNNNQGSITGNADIGALKGSAGYGSYDLGGRSIMGGLPKPGFSVNESGIVVVSITVNEDGKVINAIVGQGTTTSSSQLRNSAITAAKKALFEVKKGVTNQRGTITYKFDSDN